MLWHSFRPYNRPCAEVSLSLFLQIIHVNFWLISRQPTIFPRHRLDSSSYWPLVLHLSVIRYYLFIIVSSVCQFLGLSVFRQLSALIIWSKSVLHSLSVCIFLLVSLLGQVVLLYILLIDYCLMIHLPFIDRSCIVPSPFSDRSFPRSSIIPSSFVYYSLIVQLSFTGHSFLVH